MQKYNKFIIKGDGFSPRHPSDVPDLQGHMKKAVDALGNPISGHDPSLQQTAVDAVKPMTVIEASTVLQRAFLKTNDHGEYQITVIPSAMTSRLDETSDVEAAIIHLVRT